VAVGRPNVAETPRVFPQIDLALRIPQADNGRLIKRIGTLPSRTMATILETLQEMFAP
jgi:hypothetical protein